MSDERIQAGDPFDHFPRRPREDADSGAMVVVCPRCYHPTESLKFYDIPYFFFLYVVYLWGTHPTLACPSCMRGSLLTRLLGFPPLTTIAYPFLAIIYLVQLVRTLTPGHSDVALADYHRMHRDEQVALQQTAIPPQRQTRWILYALVGVYLLIGLWCGVHAVLGDKHGNKNARVPDVHVRKPTDVLVQELNSPDPQRRANAADTLRTHGPVARAAIPRLQALTRQDPDPQVRRLAYQALLEIDPASVIGIPPP